MAPAAPQKKDKRMPDRPCRSRHPSGLNDRRMRSDGRIYSQGGKRRNRRI